MPFREYKQHTCKRFARGVEILGGSEALHDHNGVGMELTAHASRVSWDDGNRVENSVFGTGTNCDTFGALADDMVDGATREQVVGNQALCIAIGNTQGNAEVHTMPASSILVLAAVGKNVDTASKMVPLYSADFFEAFAEYYSMAGGIFTPPKSLESQESKSSAAIDLAILGPNRSWKHADARGWAHHHYASGLTSDTLIIVNRRVYVMPESSLTIVTRTFGTSLMKLSSTSSGMFSLEMRDNCHSNHNEAIRNCSGVWKKNEESGKIEMCAVKLARSALKFTAKNVSNMDVKNDIKDDVTDEIHQEKASVQPSTGLYPFLNNTSLNGVFVATLCTGYRKNVVLRSMSSYANTEGGGTRGTTRGGGGRQTLPPSPPAAIEDNYGSMDDMEESCELSFPTIEAGKTLYEMKGLPAYDANEFTLCAPCYTILDVLVYAADEDVNVDQVALSSAEEDAKAVQLVQAVAMQIRNFNKMTVACSRATISSMDASVLTIKKADMTQEDHAVLAATNAINANASTFFNL